MDLSLKKRIFRINNRTLKKDLQLRFLHRLVRLLENGYPLIEALEIIKWDKQLVTTAELIISHLKDGQTIDQAFEHAKFSNTITSYLYVVRENGDIQSSIKKCIQMYEQRLEYVKKFQQTARYPLILFFIFLLLLYFIKQSVLPSFIDLFQGSTESSSSLFYSIIIIDIFSTLVVVFMIVLIVILLAWQLIRRKISVQQQIMLYNVIPIFRKYKRIQTSFLFSIHFSSLLKTGMSIKEILYSISEQSKLPIVSFYATRMISELSSGNHLAGLLTKLQLLEKQLALIFEKNADATALEKDLAIYAEILTEELNRKITKAITLIQPIFFIILAGFIVFIYITLMWPMFQLLKTI